MNDYDEVWQIRRGRPRKLLIDECLRLNAFFQQSLPPTEHAYRSAKTQYLKDSYSIDTENLIREALSLADVPLKDKHLPLFIFVQEGVKQMLASDIEVIVFSAIFLRQNLAELTITLEEFVKICIYLAKKQIESNLELLSVIKARLEKEINDFANKVNYFDSGENITTKDILRWSRRLNHSHESSINYSYYVDEILLKAPPYKISEKTHKKYVKRKVKNESKKRKISEDIKDDSGKTENEMKFGGIFPSDTRNKDIIIEVTTNSLEEFDEYCWPEKDTEYGLEDLE